MIKKNRKLETRIFDKRLLAKTKSNTSINCALRNTILECIIHQMNRPILFHSFCARWPAFVTPRCRSLEGTSTRVLLSGWQIFKQLESNERVTRENGMAKWCIVSSFDTVLLYPRFSLSRSVHRFAFPKCVDSRVEMLKSGEEWKLENDRENDDIYEVYKREEDGWKWVERWEMTMERARNGEREGEREEDGWREKRHNKKECCKRGIKRIDRVFKLSWIGSLGRVEIWSRCVRVSSVEKKMELDGF